MTSNDWFFGIDSGATQSRLYAHSATGDSNFQLLGGPANIFRQGKKQVASILSKLINRALEKLPQGVLRAVHAGVAGASTLETEKDLTDHICTLVKSRHSVVVSLSGDGQTALEGAWLWSVCWRKKGPPLHCRYREWRPRKDRC